MDQPPPSPSSPLAALIVAAGPGVDTGLARLDPAAFDLVVAADGGLDRALARGIVPDLVVGDLDSVGAAALAEARRLGARVVAHPRDKDETDLELALAAAIEAGAATATVVCDGGGRLDHAVANLCVLASPRWRRLALRALVDEHEVHVVRTDRPCRLTLPPGARVSLLPVGGPATGVTTRGLRFALEGGRLEAWAGRGVSNEVVSSPVEVSVTAGVVLVVVGPVSASSTPTSDRPDARG
ncbi:MAG: thiamine diphosphokinase [Actinomyces sp.]|nr:MAG: thiamine diphosphokinase [Actinomyces sp.]